MSVPLLPSTLPPASVMPCTPRSVSCRLALAAASSAPSSTSVPGATLALLSMAPTCSQVPPRLSALPSSRVLPSRLVPALLSRLRWLPVSRVLAVPPLSGPASTRVPVWPLLPLRRTPPLPAFTRSAAPSPVRVRVSALPVPLPSAVIRAPAATTTLPLAARVRSPRRRGSALASTTTWLALVRTLRWRWPSLPVVASPRLPPSSTLAAPLALSCAAVSTRVSAAAVPPVPVTRMDGALMFRSPPAAWRLMRLKSSWPSSARRVAARFSVPASAGPRGAAMPLASAWAAKVWSASLSSSSDDRRATACGTSMKVAGLASCSVLPAVPSRAPTRLLPSGSACALPGASVPAAGRTRKPPGSSA